MNKETLKKNIAIILASGVGERTGLDKPKQFVKIAGKTVIEHTLDTFEKHKLIDEIIIVSNINYVQFVSEIVLKNNYKKVTKILAGGKTRRESSYIGIFAINEEDANVLLHDAVRPFLDSEIINKCIEALKQYKAVDVAIESADTLIRVNDNNLIEKIPDRTYFRRGQTPQGFDLKTIKKAHLYAQQEKNINVTDDCSLILKYKLCDIYVIKGDDFNHKITYPIDFAIADKLFQMKSISVNSLNKEKLENKVIVIFGASRGIGQAIYKEAKELKAKVYGFSRSNNVDISNFEQIKAALCGVYKIEKRIDYIINTAGVLNMGQLSCRNLNEIIKEIEINYIGCINAAKASYQYLKETKGCLVFFTSSSYTRGRQLYSIYSSTKAAVVNLSQALSEEWAKDGIRINVVNPERTRTPMRFNNFGEEPVNSLLSPDKVADSTLNVLLSDFSGQVIDVRREIS